MRGLPFHAVVPRNFLREVSFLWSSLPKKSLIYVAERIATRIKCDRRRARGRRRAGSAPGITNTPLTATSLSSTRLCISSSCNRLIPRLTCTCPFLTTIYRSTLEDSIRIKSSTPVRRIRVRNSNREQTPPMGLIFSSRLSRTSFPSLPVRIPCLLPLSSSFSYYRYYSL